MSGKLLRSQDGVALPLALGTILLLSLVAVGVLIQVRSELRTQAMEPDVAQAQILIWSGLNEARRLAEEPGMGFGDEPAVDPSAADSLPPAPCSPEPGWAAPHYCLQALRRIEGEVTGIEGSTAQIPVVVYWRLRESDPLRPAYGWIVLTDSGRSLGVSNQVWCTPSQTVVAQACRQGG